MKKSFQDVIDRMDRVRDVPAKVESFARMEEAFRRLVFPFPEKGQGVILVAGTNGKGTVAKTLETLLLRVGGGGVGLFTSPHLMTPTERIRSFGRDLSEREFVQTYEIVEPVAQDLALSHFETQTLMACEIFFGQRVRPRVDWAVIEVGVGGRLDPTRLIPHEMSVVTSIGLDHVDLLGSTIKQIAPEKFAIVDDGALVHLASTDSDVEAAAAKACAGKAVKRVVVEPFPFHVAPGPVWVVETPWGEAPLHLLGRRAVENVSLALAVYRELGFSPDEALPALRQIEWPCRMEPFHLRGRTVYLSGDHNQQGVASLREILEHFQYENLQLVVGIGGKKDVDGMLTELSRLPRARLRLTTTTFRGQPLSAYGEKWLGQAAATDADPAIALERALTESQPGDLILVTGSLYMTGDLRRMILAGRFG